MSFTFKLFKASNYLLSIILPKRAVSRADKLFFVPNKFPPKAWELQAETQASRVHLDNGASCLVWGEDSRPHKILMMHGWEGRASQMSVFLSKFSDEYQLIAIDAPAHGRTPGTRANPIVFAYAIAAAQRQFGDFKAIIGHSMGAGVSIYCALEGIRTEAVVAIAGPSCFQRIAGMFARHIGLSAKVQQSFLEKVLSTIDVEANKIDLASRLEDLQVPLLLVHDRTDLEVPFTEATRLAKHLLNGEVLVTNGLGHRKIMRDEGVISAVHEFVTRTD